MSPGGDARRPMAIGVMARPPIAGRCKTRLLTRFAPDWVAGLAEAMVRDTLAAVDAAGFEVRVVLAAPRDDDDVDGSHGVASLAALAPVGWAVMPQARGDLGARMEAGLRALLEGPVACAALIGTDAPLAPLGALRRAMEDLASGIAVGPAHDGGYWTIAMRRLESRVLRGMPWSTPHLVDATRARCAAEGLAVVEIDGAFDVDEPADVDHLARVLDGAPHLAPHTARWLAGGPSTP